MLAGTVVHTLDAKGRVVLPADFRRQLGDPIILTRAPEGVVMVFSQTQWRSYLRRNIRDEAFREYFFSSATTVVPHEETGRILIPSTLRHHAGLRTGADVAVAGLGYGVAICAWKRWDARIRHQEERVLAMLSGPAWSAVRACGPT